MMDYCQIHGYYEQGTVLGCPACSSGYFVFVPTYVNYLPSMMGGLNSER